MDSLLSLARAASNAVPIPIPNHSSAVEDEDVQMSSSISTPSSSWANTGTSMSVGSVGSTTKRIGKKRGNGELVYKCETCAKIYRHPSCLIKHRWEHTPHWRTLSSLPNPSSKHQQVQLLEAAAILSGGRSLPEDRGLWPEWSSGGLLLPSSIPNHTSSSEEREAKEKGFTTTTTPNGFHISSGNKGPRLFDFEVGAHEGARVISRKEEEWDGEMEMDM